MSEHLDANLREGYLQRTLSPEQLIRVDTHLATCEECRRLVADAAQVQKAFPSLLQEFRSDAVDAMDHPTYERLAAYIDGKLRGAQLREVESHFTECGVCVERLESLRVLQEERMTTPTPAPAPARAPVWEKLRALLPLPASSTGQNEPRSRPLQQTLIPALGMIAVAIVVSLVYQSRVHSLQSQLGEVRDDLMQRSMAQRERDRESIYLKQQQTRLQQERDQIVGQVRDLTQRLTSTERALRDTRKALAQKAASGNESGGSLAQTRLQSPSREVAALLKQDTLMGEVTGEKVFALLSPVSVVVESERPTFRWKSVPGATSYRISMSEGQNVTLEVAHETVTKTEWKPSAALKRGHLYTWQVIPLRGKTEIPDVVSLPVRARFRVLAQHEAEVFRLAAQNSIEAQRNLAVRYANAGVFDRAVAILKSLQQQDPRDTRTQQLLRQIEDRRKPRP